MATVNRFFVGLMTFVASTVLAESFPDKCPDGAPLPFTTIQLSHPIDHTCGLQGKLTSPEPSHIQNKVKNNFCASGQPEEISPQKLIDLQANTTIPSGHGQEPSDRAPLQAMGEGELVRMKAFLVEAHHADLGSGESVNCNGGTEEGNDIHIALAATDGAQECESVSAEISPHFRPVSWNEIGHYEIFNSTTKKYVPGPAMVARLTAHPYRITGQLFFDASHGPCPCNVDHCNPIRSSVWEIHPVYAIDVCRAGTACDENSDGDWMAFDTWWKSLLPLKKPKGPHTHGAHEPH